MPIPASSMFEHCLFAISLICLIVKWWIIFKAKPSILDLVLFVWTNSFGPANCYLKKQKRRKDNQEKEKKCEYIKH